MGTKEQETLNQQRERRKRINRMKTMIIMTISGWMLLSFISIIILFVQLISVNRKLDKLTNASIISSEKVDDNEANIDDDVNLTYGTEFYGVETGIDSPENMASEGDVHQVYLTFDCIPSENTDAILDVLKERNIKATFFVVGDESEEAKEIYKRIVDEGHTLGMHSFSNQYSTIFASKESFISDYTQFSDYLFEVTGVKSEYYRFPGGSGNQISNVNMVDLVRVLNENQITYYDWNVSAGDAASTYTSEEVVNNVITGVEKYKTSVVLLHDDKNKSTTVEALIPLLDELDTMGADVLPIDKNTNVIQYIKAESV